MSEVSMKAEKQRREDEWVEVLESTVINDEKWWCMVTMMVEAEASDSRIVSLFNEAAEKGKRRAIYALSRQKAVSSALNVARRDLEECSALDTFCRFAGKMLSEEHESLSTWLTARLIKYLVYRVKVESVDREGRETESELRIEEEFRAMLNGKDFGESKPSKGEGSVRKVGTRLRKRGENWRDDGFLNDAPLGGAYLYIVLTGFHDPALPLELIKVGVPLTCVLRVKGRAKNPSYNPNNGSTRLTRFSRDYRANQDDLIYFWSKMERDLLGREKTMEYSDFVFKTFCPPEPPATFDAEQRESLKKDMYDRVSYIVYDIYDLWRQYVKYMRSMKVLSVHQVDQNLDTSIYENFLDNIPPEVISVPIVLTAMLIQIEANFSDFSSSSSLEDDVSYTQETVDSESCEEPEARLILQGDYLAGCLRSADFNDRLRRTLNVDEISEDPLVDAILPVLLDSRVVDLCRKYEESSEAQSTRKQMQEDDGTNGRLTLIDRQDVVHYLHLLLFEEMMDHCSVKTGDSSSLEMEKKVETEEERDAFSFLERVAFQPPKHRSLPNFPLSKASSIDRAQSDSFLNYGRMSREDSLDPPRHDSKDSFDSFEFGETGNSAIDEYDYVELLPARVFLQKLYECFVTFDRLATRYVEQTGSLLLCFHESRGEGIVREETSVSRVRTPVCFREFCEHVRAEEEAWARREEEEHRAEVARERSSRMAKPQGISSLPERCFILPESLKARNPRGNGGSKERRGLDSRDDEDEGEGTKEEPRGEEQDREELSRGKGWSAEGKGESLKGTMSTGKSTGKSTGSIDRSFLPPRKIVPVGCVAENERSEFLGYNVDSSRVEVVSSTKTFRSADDTRVSLEISEWHRGNKEFRLALAARGFRLYFPLLILPDASRSSDVFHLTTDKGVVLAFARTPDQPFGGSQSWRKDSRSRLAVDFRASWPTGLSIDTLLGDAPENPFYVRQSYVCKGSICEDVKRETCRKFLRNGTLLKYLNDGSVMVLRPNGVIVTCTAFGKVQRNRTNSRKNPLKGKTKSRSSKKPQRRVSNKSSSKGAERNVFSEKTTFQGEFSRVGVSEYTVLDYDGRRYDVLRGRMVREYEGTVLRSASDYRLDQKFIRRSDGTNMLFESNGDLTVCFNDGTRITTGYVIEERAVTCDWSRDEPERFDGYGESNEESIERFESVLSTDRSRSTIRSSRREVERTLSDESFVSVLLTCRFEHKNYARVVYDPSAITATLHMPGELCVSLTRDRRCEISLGNQVSLEVEREKVTVRHVSCDICGRRSTSVFKPEATWGPIFRLRGVAGEVLEIDKAGTVRYQKRAEAEGDEGEAEVIREESDTAIDKKLETPCRHVGETSTVDAYSRPNCRIFGVQANLTAREYLRRAVSQELAASATLENGAILQGIPPGSRSRFVLTFVPFDPDEQSRSWLQPYSAPKLGELGDRSGTDSLPSTYSCPYHWLYPFGKSCRGSLTSGQNVSARSKLLKVRVLQQFKDQGQMVAAELQKALRSYRESMIGESCTDEIADEEISEDVIPELEQLSEEEILNIALAVKKCIRMETYERGLQRETGDRGQKILRKSEERRRVSSEWSREDLEWFKKCKRENIVMPYFRNITGACHLWVKSCVENAVEEISQTSSENQSFLAVEG